MNGPDNSVNIRPILWRRANLATRNLGINALIYLTQVVSLIWLFSLGLANVARIDYLLIGAALVLTSNTLINFQPVLGAAWKNLAFRATNHTGRMSHRP